MTADLMKKFLLACLLLGACAAAETNAPARQPPDAPRFELRAGENYFRVAGRPTFVLGRNPAALRPQDYAAHFRHVAEAGERFVRIHFTFLPPGEKPGTIAPGMLKVWDEILDAAEREQLGVLPVLGVWADWNDGSHKETWHRWEQNPFNSALGGPAKNPAELFDDTPCRKLWLQRLELFVRHWSPRRAIVGWEIFSELDLVTGATEPRAVAFTEAAAATIRAADPWKRPVTAAQAGINGWPRLLRSDALDFIEIHPYTDGAFGGRLDELILATVRARLATYGKPVLIGECGLDSGPPHGTLDTAPRAEFGIRHAIWAALVSGALNGRALWWQDGFDFFEHADVCSHYHTVAAPAAAFVRGTDYTGFAPVPCTLSATLKGALLGNGNTILGWFRDAACEPPAWPQRPLAGQTVSAQVPDALWSCEFFDPTTGKSIGKTNLTPRAGRIEIALPEFQDALALRLTR